MRMREIVRKIDLCEDCRKEKAIYTYEGKFSDFLTNFSISRNLCKKCILKDRYNKFLKRFDKFE